MNIPEKIKELYLKNRRVTDGHTYTVPSTTTYPYQWLWDSCFHSIVLSYFDIDQAKEELRSLVSAQFDDGMIPHMIYWEKGELHVYDWGKPGTSSITQPPMLAYAVGSVYRKTKDREFLLEMYEPMKRFYSYLIKERDPRDHHLIGIINPDESGEDNSPRFDSLLDLPPEHTLEEHLRRRMVLIEENRSCNFDAELCMKQYFWVKDVPFNAITILNLDLLIDLAKVLDFQVDAHYFSIHADLIREAMREKMLEDGLFFSTKGEEYERIRTKTWAIFAPLFAGLFERDEAESLIVNHFHNAKEFSTRYLLPTVSLDEDSFDPRGFWRGPVWMSVNWFVYKGLRRYGYLKEAESLKQSSLNLLQESGFREYFNPLTGEGMGAEDFTWGGLVIDMI